jgi:subtilase family serine protease
MLATTPAGYSPAQLQDAYGLPAANLGQRQTVAVVEAGGDPNAESDLAVYRSQYGLPACTSSDGCLTFVNQTGGTTLPPPDTGYTQQIPTDLDMVSALCPNCHIKVVEASDNSITNLGQAVNEAVSAGAHVVDFSYFGPEDPGETTQWDGYFNHPGVAITAAAGNSGYTGGPLNYPAASPYVLSVGGTVLNQGGATGCTTSQAGSRGWCESAWSQATSGCSQYEPKPAWQGATGCSGRADNDLAAVASSASSPSAPVAVYDSYNNSGWIETGETGVSAPIVAGIFGDAGTPGASDNPAAYPYQHPGGSYINPGTAYPYFDGLNDITSGSTGSCSTGDLCGAGPGWDGPTGLGSLASQLSLTASGSLTSPNFGDLGGSNKCMDNYHGNLTDSNTVDIWDCDGGTNSQQWTFQSDGTVHVNGSSYCLGVSAGGTANGTHVILFSCDGFTSQQWRIKANGQLVNENSGSCLDNPTDSTTNGTQLQIWTCNTNIQQDWSRLAPEPASTGPILLQPHPGDCIDNYQGKLADNNKVDIYGCNGGSAQNWSIQPNGTIQNGTSGYCLGVSGGGVTNGTVLILFTCNSHTSQEWIPQSSGSLRNLNSATCLDDPTDTTVNGTQLQIWTCNGNPQQNWTLP